MIKKGDKFKCIKTLIYGNSDLWYQKGKIYWSDMDGCITDEEGDIDHEWIDEIEKYFIPYISKDMDVKVGRRYRCIREVRMNDNPEEIKYVVGKIYKSEVEGCITDEKGVKLHYWNTKDGLFEKTFTLVSNKRNRDGNRRNCR